MVFCLWSLVSGLILTGCIRRNLTIRTDPPGATLLVNDQAVGVTPKSWDFEWYGWYRISLLKDGFERFDDRVLLKAPVYFWVPLDLVMELMPFPVSDAREMSYQLTPRRALSEPAPPSAEETPSEAQPTKTTETGNGQAG